VLENRVLMRIFGPKSGEITGEITRSFTICKISELNNAPFFRVNLNHFGMGLYR
jgi:hypothetical protein